MKIALSGGQGLGKTTLAKSISNLYDIPLLQADTQKFMPDGVKSHADVLKMAVEKPEIGIKFQEDIIEARLKLFQTHDKFISDRAVCDSYIYYLCHNSMFDKTANSVRLKLKVVESLRCLDFLVLFIQKHKPYDDGRDNGIRFTNDSYLSHINNSIIGEFETILHLAYEDPEELVPSYESIEFNGMRCKFYYLNKLDVFLTFFEETLENRPDIRAEYLFRSLKNMYNEKIKLNDPLLEFSVKNLLAN